MPDVPGLDSYKGKIYHSSFWPSEGVPFANKRVGIIGTGASGVQIIQEMGATAKQLTVYQRTPNLALPMGRKDLTADEQNRLKPFYPEIHAMRERCFAGFHYDLNERNTFDDTPEEREAFMEKLWKQAGFALWLGGYKDYLFVDKCNRESYNFWRKKQSPRVKDPKKKEILFPEEPPHPFGVKRPCLEQNYYEVLDKDTTDVVDISDKKGGTPIEKFTEKGIVTDGQEREFDIIVLATGFDVVSIILTYDIQRSSTYPVPGYRRYDEHGLKIHQRNIPPRRVEAFRTHVLGNHNLGVPEHVPFVRWVINPPERVPNDLNVY